ncbi:NAD(P)-binding domain-containing protein [Methanococcoides methylutens]|uniref:NAD(P)-binding domain-containing protein n=1 Tax=Methanococcoides methylutens TaxID=2226 RepID=UPI0040450E3A
MKIAILGGTGNIGKGFALRWGPKHDVIVGSRSAEKAIDVAAEYTRILRERGIDATIEGMDNKAAAEVADIIVFAIRYEQVPSVIELITPVLKDQVIVSVVVPMEKDRCYIKQDSKDKAPVTIDAKDSRYNADYFCYTTPAAGSAAEEMAHLLPEGIEIVSAFHNVPAKKLADLDLELDYDIAVCGNCMHSKKIVFDLVRDIPNMRPLDIGPIETSGMVESLTPLVINIAIRNKMHDVGIRFV